MSLNDQQQAGLSGIIECIKNESYLGRRVDGGLFLRLELCA